VEKYTSFINKQQNSTAPAAPADPKQIHFSTQAVRQSSSHVIEKLRSSFPPNQTQQVQKTYYLKNNNSKKSTNEQMSAYVAVSPKNGQPQALGRRSTPTG